MSCAPLFFCAFTGLEYSFFQLFLCSIRRRGSSEILIKIRDTSLWKFVPFSRQAECEKFRLCHDTGSACYDCQELLRNIVIPTFSLSRPLSEKLINRLFFLVKVGITFSPCVSFQHYAGLIFCCKIFLTAFYVGK